MRRRSEEEEEEEERREEEEVAGEEEGRWRLRSDEQRNCARWHIKHLGKRK